MNKIALAALLSVAVLSGCKSETKTDTLQSSTYNLIGNSGDTIGEVRLTETKTGVLVNVTASGISEGEHGIHMHHTGSCLTPDFKSAGGHINPMNKAHGLSNPEGPDNADMPNAVADSKGLVNFTFENTRISLKGLGGRPALLDDNGSALVMHQNPDDGITQPIGGAGPRIACAQIN